MTLTFNWSESDYVSAYWTWLRRHPWKVVLGFWYSLFILAMVVVAAIRSRQNWRTQLAYVGVALGAGLIGYIRTRWSLHRYFRKNLFPDGLVTATVDDRGISLNAHGAGKALLWKEVSQVHESTRVVVIEKGKEEYVFLPKSAMSDPQVYELRGFAASAGEQYRRNISDSSNASAEVIGVKIACVDDVPALARLAARQRFFMRWYQALGLAPFAVVLIIVLGVFPNSSSPILEVLIFAALVWPLAVVIYTVYLWMTLRCPACHNRFGMGDNCRSCKLPRHPQSSGLFRTNS